MLITPRTFRLAQIPDGGSGEASRWASKKEHGPVLKGPISRERARSMLLVHQAGSVKIGEVVRYVGIESSRCYRC